MKTDHGDVWSYQAEWRIITTNGILNRNGHLVMGAGIAAQAKRYFPNLPEILGRWVKCKGNTPCFVRDYKIISFPTKHHYRDRSPFPLIRQSATIIQEDPRVTTAVMPPPGCGLGGWRWNEIMPMLSEILDDRFTVLIPRSK